MLDSTMLRRVGAAAATALLAVVAGLVASHPAAAAACPPPVRASQPFLAWGDSNLYVPATGGSFEPGSPAWTLTGGASVVSDNAPSPVDPAGSSNALALPSGASAVSPCTTSPRIVGLVRLWAKNVGNPWGTLRVDVIVHGVTYPAGMFAADGTWQPSPILLSLAPHYLGATGFQVRLTALGGLFRVDDVYIDPYSGR